ncbi:HAD hydrolase family protein [Staphylococcus aureus]
MVKAIAVDMDGTFLDSKKTYDKPRFEAIFTELRNRDITFIVEWQSICEVEVYFRG